MLINEIKQVIIIRNDLNMRRGKSEAQAAHSAMKVFFDRMTAFNNGSAMIDFTPQMIEWMKSSFKKISLGCDSEKELLHLKNLADEAEIINALILDNGETEFKIECENCFGDGHYEICPDCNNKKVYMAHDAGAVVKLFCNVCKKFIITAKEEKCLICNGTGKVSKPTYTALAIGPDYVSKIDVITGHLKLR